MNTTNGITNVGTITATTINSSAINTDTLQPLTGSDINGNSANLVNFERVKATTLYGDFIQANTASGITFNNSIDMGSGNITNVVDVAGTEVHLTDAIYTNSIQSLNTGTVEFRTNNVSNINNLYVTTGIDTNLVYTNYLASSNGTVYLQTGTNLDGGTFGSLCNFNTVLGSVGTFATLNTATINTNSAPNITVTSDINMSNKTIKNITGLSSIYISTGTLRVSVASTNSLFVSSINNKRYVCRSTIGAPYFPSSFTLDGSITTPILLISSLNFFNGLGTYDLTQRMVFTKLTGSVDAYGSILVHSTNTLLAPDSNSGYGQIPFVNDNNHSTFTTLHTSVNIGGNSQQRQYKYLDTTGGIYTGRLYLDKPTITYVPSVGFGGE